MINARTEARLKEAGRIGARKGMRPDENPFPAGSYMHKAWSAGYDEQKATMKRGQKAAARKIMARKKAAGKKPAIGKKPAAKKRSGAKSGKKPAAGADES